MLWLRLEKTKYAPNDVAKQALGMMVLGLGFIIMAKAQVLSDQLGKVGPHWLFMVFAVHTLGELMLSPVGLSMVSRVSPAKLSALLMGVWMLSSAIAGYLAGSLEALLKHTDFTLYPFLATISIGAGFILLLLSPYLNQLMQTTEKSP
jgi:POT family proton-dependent oligopeptide transporter